MRIANTISLLRPAGFDVILACSHSRLREALLKAMPSPKRLFKVSRETVRLVEVEEDDEDRFFEAISAILCSIIVLLSAVVVAPFL